MLPLNVGPARGFVLLHNIHFNHLATVAFSQVWLLSPFVF